MKYALVIILLSALGFGAWFAVGTWRRQTMLDSGKPILLVNPSLGVYSYSDLMAREDITRDFKIIGYTENLSDEQIRWAIDGFEFVAGLPLPPGDERGILVRSAELVLPNPAQQTAWSALVSTLPTAQQTVCAAITDASTSQYCLAQHAVFNAWRIKAGAAMCAALYIQAQQTECEEYLTSYPTNVFVDANSNQLIDVFEELALPAEQRSNDRNLPIINLGG